MDVNIFIPCFIDQFYPETGMNMVKILEKAGCKVNYNKKQTCCGQLAYNSGFWDDAREVGKKFIKDFSEDKYIVSPSASCVGYVRNYFKDLFEDGSLRNEYKQVQKNIYELTEFLVDILNVTDFGAKLEGVATYHDSCTALRECNIKEGPRALLKNVKGLELKEMDHVETCCGFGGKFSVNFPSISVGMAEQKIDNALATKADYLISTDLSCLMHLEGYIKYHKLSLKPMHIADVLASGW